MLGLSKKSNRFIGVDFGTSSIKITVLSSKGGRPVLANYGIFDLKQAFYTENKKEQKNQTYDDKLKKALSVLFLAMDLEGGSVCVSMPGFSGLVVLIEFPDMKEDEIGKAIQFEAHKHIPASIEEVSISWEIFGKKNVRINNSSKITTTKVQVILVAAPKKDVEKFGNLIEHRDFKTDAIELETFSIARSLIGNDKGRNLIIDMGHLATNIMLVERGYVIMNRNINAGGNDITKSISDSMNISEKRAESLKKEEKDMLNSSQNPIVVPALDLILDETKRVMGAFYQRHGNENGIKIDNIIVSGGTSDMAGIEKYFSDALGIKVIKGNPWKGLEVESRLQPFVSKMGASFSASIGAALRSMEDSMK